MKTHDCYCGNTLHFENTACLECGREVAFLPDLLRLAAVETDGDGLLRPLPGNPRGTRYRRCRNDWDYQVCNWLVAAEDPDAYCSSCRLNHMIPDLDSPKNRTLWYRVEASKRRLMYSILRLGLPYVGRDRDASTGLAFQFLEDIDASIEFSDCAGENTRIMTGHGNGLITINLAEADHIAREVMRERMNEEYRTLLGHFRHESGHYFWDRLIRDSEWLEQFRALFGDERIDYASALSHHYQHGPQAGWERDFISAYAASHPWEDWAETWAHYLNMIDTLETATDFGFAAAKTPRPPSDAAQLSLEGINADSGDFDLLIEDWVGLTNAMNAINLSMGLQEAYPFTLGVEPIAKLRFIHALVRRSARGR